MSNYYPVFLNLAGKRCIVVGGGDIAERKVINLLECGAKVTVISSELTPKLQELSETSAITLLKRPYRQGDLMESFLAIAATDNQKVNRACFQEAAALNIPVNVVDQTDLCSFIAPSIVRRGGITIAFSTGGKSPALARKLREDLERLFPPEYGTLLDVVSQIRQEVRRQGLSPSPEAWQEALNEEILELIRMGDVALAKTKLQSILQQAAS
ncbi:MAG: bifunctional precorrin-2 dehydrogenase/sirohydrochlorin ferrochelatase [Chloroflexi bacterium]|nr:bifunctional precorrin-2 dehydrogenase/sirohydrochlorin ferrochelatase [Chloroflexota bacterium]